MGSGHQDAEAVAAPTWFAWLWQGGRCATCPSVSWLWRPCFCTQARAGLSRCARVCEAPLRSRYLFGPAVSFRRHSGAHRQGSPATWRESGGRAAQALPLCSLAVWTLFRYREGSGHTLRDRDWRAFARGSLSAQCLVRRTRRQLHTQRPSGSVQIMLYLTLERVRVGISLSLRH